MSFHAGQTFVFGEQPSATKWQYLWDNDYALADGSGISDNAIGSRQIQLANDAPLYALNSGAVEKKLLRLDNDNYLRLSQLPYKAISTGSTKEDVLIQSGWDFGLSTSSPSIVKAVTFPVAFDSGGLLAVFLTIHGLKNSDPTAVTDIVDYGNDIVVGAKALANTGFTAALRTADGNSFSAGQRWIFSWVAIGTKA